MRSGVFVSVEGVDGSGKTLQVDLLCRRLEERGTRYLRTREPGGTPVGDAIRAILLDPASVMTVATEAYLYAASRAEHVRRIIRPALAAGMTVVCDRFVDASVAYQGYGMADADVTVDAVREINRYAVGGCEPNLTIVIDVPVAVALRRLRARAGENGEDRIERRGPEFFRRVREGLLAIRESDPRRVRWIDGDRPPHEVAGDVWASVANLIGG
jgi:dTMP kinase